jgi:hypothetical protein
MTSVGRNGLLGQLEGEGPGKGRFILDSDRFKVLDRKQQYFDCTQHDYKRYDFDGRIIELGGGVVQSAQPLMSGEKASNYIPLRGRRPSTPYRLARVITSSFTSLLLGDQRFPTLQVLTDPKTQDYVQTLSRLSSLPVKMVQARNLGGSTGTACLSWAYVNGRPRVRVHNAKFVHVQSWEDRDEFVPRHVIECYQSTEQVWSPEKRQLVSADFWHRRDWTPNLDVVFMKMPVQRGKDPVWIPDWEKCVEHNDRLCHFVWIQNLPATDADGQCDYEGLFDNFDTLDLLLSVITRGATLNLDPTLVLKMDPDAIGSGVRKGSDNAIVPGVDGDAHYLELVGSSITAGINLFNKKRETTLEVAQCVLPDPDKVAAAGTSSVAMKMMYAPMIGKGDLFRDQYGGGMRRVLEPLVIVAQRSHRTKVFYLDGNLNPHEEYRIPRLPPKVDKETGDDGQEKVTLTQREPGQGEEVDPVWGPYFQATPNDKQVTAGALSVATGQKAFMPASSATEEMAKLLGRDPDDEKRSMTEEQDEAEGKQNQMFSQAAAGAPGSKVQHSTPTPGGGQMTRTVAPQAPPPSESSSSEPPIPLTPAAAQAVITVNEARHSMGLDPMPGPDGMLSLAAFQAKYSVPIAMAANAALGKTGTSPAGAPIGAPGGGSPKPPAPPGAGAPPGGAPGAPPAHPPAGAPPGPPGATSAPHPAPAPVAPPAPKPAPPPIPLPPPKLK